MFTIKEITKNKHQLLEIVDANTNTKATLNLSLGGSLQELFLSNKKIIEDITDSYKSTYSSAILFPFINRVDDGKYTFKETEYLLNINEPKQNNAIHGLVYNKAFFLKSKVISSDEITISLMYNEIEKQEGFPFTYQIELEYKLTSSSIDLKVNVKNTDENEFPFTIGWHPYFYSSEVSKSSISFKSNKTIKFNDKSITETIIIQNQENNILLNHKNFDDCYGLASNKVVFKTPEYTFELDTDKPNSYLQIYTPEKLNMVAIEPQTGISDSFNNKEGLQILNKNKSYTITWQIHLINQNT